MANTKLPARYIRHVVVPAAQARDRSGVMCFLGGQTRKGEWDLSRHFRVACVAGAVELDLREARIPDGESTIEIYALFGSVEIIFPPGVRIDAGGDGLFGSFEVTTDPTIPTPPDAPTIRLVGDAYFSSVEGVVRFSGESARDAKRRLKNG
jgi:hypothetical protein